MSKLDNVHQPDQVAGTVLSKEFYADKPLNSFEIYALYLCWIVMKHLRKIIVMVFSRKCFQVIAEF